MATMAPVQMTNFWERGFKENYEFPGIRDSCLEADFAAFPGEVLFTGAFHMAQLVLPADTVIQAEVQTSICNLPK